MMGLTVWFATFLIPIKNIKKDFSFQRLFVQYGGNWAVLGDFINDFGSDVVFHAGLFLAPPSDGPLSGTVLHPSLLRRMEQVERDFRAREEVPTDGVASLLTVPDMYGEAGIEPEFVRKAFHRYEALRKVARLTDAQTLACFEAQQGCDKVSTELLESMSGLVDATKRLLQHQIYRRRVVSVDGRAAMLTARYRNGYSTEELRLPLTEYVQDHEVQWGKDLPKGASVSLTGIPIIEHMYAVLSLREVMVFLPITMLIIVAMLWLLFRWAWAMIVPLVVVIMAVIWIMGFMQFMGEPLNMLNNVTSTVILVVGIADAIHYVARYLAEYRIDRDKNEALVRTVGKLGWACLLTSATTAVGFGSLMSASIPTIKNFGLYIGIGVAFAYVITLIMLPIMFSFAGPPPDRSVPAKGGDRLERALARIGRFSLGRPRIVSAMAAVVVIVCVGLTLGVPALGWNGVQNESRLLEEIQHDHPIYITTHQTQDRLSGLLVHSLYVRGRAVEGVTCRQDRDCVERCCSLKDGAPSLRLPQQCAAAGGRETPGACGAPPPVERVCQRYNIFHRFSGRLARTLGILADAHMEPFFSDLERSAMRLVSSSAPDGAEEIDEDLSIEDESETEEAGAVPDSVIGGLCVATVDDPRLLGHLDSIRRDLLSDPKHKGFITRVDDLSSLTREMYAVMHGSPELVDRGDFPLTTRAAVGQVLVPLSQDDTGMLSRVRTPDGTRTQMSFLVTDRGSAGWRLLRSDLQRHLRVLHADPAIGPHYEVIITGSSSLAQDAMSRVVWDLVTSLLLAFAVIFVIMAILFRSLRIGLISMVPNLLPLLMTLGLMGLMGITLRMSTAVIFSVSLGIAVDDTIHLLERFREEFRKDRNLDEAMIRTLTGTGRAIFLTTVILATGFSVTMLSDFIAMYQFGLLTAFTLVSAFIADIFFTPALIRIFRLDRSIRLDSEAAASYTGDQRSGTEDGS
jgi:hypothetical protein